MTEPTTHPLGGAELFASLPRPDLSSPDIPLHLWTRVMALKEDHDTATPVSIAAHLRQCALVLDHAFITLMREALDDNVNNKPVKSRCVFETGLYAQNLFIQIIEQLRRSDQKKSAKRTSKKRKLVRAW